MLNSLKYLSFGCLFVASVFSDQWSYQCVFEDPITGLRYDLSSLALTGTDYFSTVNSSVMYLNMCKSVAEPQCGESCAGCLYDGANFYCMAQAYTVQYYSLSGAIDGDGCIVKWLDNSTNSTYDLLPLMAESHYTLINGTCKFLLNLCGPISGSGVENCEGHNICMQDSHSHNWTNLGTLQQLSEIPVVWNSSGVRLFYHNEVTNGGAYVDLVCDYNAGMGSPVYVGQEGVAQTTYSFVWLTVHACPIEVSRGVRLRFSNGYRGSAIEHVLACDESSVLNEPLYVGPSNVQTLSPFLWTTSAACPAPFKPPSSPAINWYFVLTIALPVIAAIIVVVSVIYWCRRRKPTNMKVYDVVSDDPYSGEESSPPLSPANGEVERLVRQSSYNYYNTNLPSSSAGEIRSTPVAVSGYQSLRSTDRTVRPPSLGSYSVQQH